MQTGVTLDLAKLMGESHSVKPHLLQDEVLRTPYIQGLVECGVDASTG